MSFFLPLTELMAEGAGMNLRHIAKMTAMLTVLFLGFQFGRDIANKVNSSTTSTTPA